MQGVHKGTLAEHLGIRFVEATPERVVAELDPRPALTTVGGALHGGTLMALADTVGAAATFLNLPAGAGTTTLESKTNFFAAGKSGTVRAEATPLHRGRRTQVWQTRVTDEAGKLLSLTIQTQMVLIGDCGASGVLRLANSTQARLARSAPAAPPACCGSQFNSGSPRTIGACGAS